MKPATSKRLTKQILRELRGPYSQRETATAIGISQEGYQEWELGKAQPNPENFRALLDHFSKWKRHYGQDPQPTIDRMLDLLFEQLTTDNQTNTTQQRENQ